MLHQDIYPHDANPAPSYCRFFFNAAQQSGDLVNDSPTGSVAAKHASFADGTCWATAGYATIGGSATNYATIGTADSDLDLLDGSVVITARLKKVAAALPGAEQYWFAGYRPGAEYGGFILTMQTTGAVRLFINSVDNQTINVASASNTFSDGVTANEIGIVCIADRNAAGSAYLIINGLTETSVAMGAVGGKSTNGNRGIRLGVNLAGSAADASRVRGLGGYVVPKDVSLLDRKLIADWHQRNPHLPIPDWVFGL